MTDTVIQVENLSKKYAISHQKTGGYDTLRDRITNAVKSFGKKGTATKEEFWALKDVSFEIKQGSRLGIIGRNGAGKSTLLKILSRITEPTKGQITINGRIASLLEVGTGFHPELTGRENIFLNGAILGMSKAEIKKKFDEIVAFAEIEKFLDTPVKRYSSGMYVRLAFAVAAHLEPEILIVDEVLAVGDIQFQKKCLGKMEKISENEGRTVLFVSHNIDAIQRLCSHCTVLHKGQLIAHDITSVAIQKYLDKNILKSSPYQWIDLSKLTRTGKGDAQFIGVQYYSPDSPNSGQPYPEGSLTFELLIASNAPRTVSCLAVNLISESGVILINMDTLTIGRSIHLKKGINNICMTMKSLHLKSGIYSVALWLDKTGTSSSDDCLDYIESAFELEVFNPTYEEFAVEVIGPVVCNFDIVEAGIYRNLPGKLTNIF